MDRFVVRRTIQSETNPSPETANQNEPEIFANDEQPKQKRTIYDENRSYNESWNHK